MSNINKQSKLNQFEKFELPAKKQETVKGGIPLTRGRAINGLVSTPKPTTTQATPTSKK